MERSTKPPRTLFSVTFTVLVALAAGIFFFSKVELPPAIVINTEGQPTLGYAQSRVHVVLFEEPKCTMCADFNARIFPVLKKEYIDTNKISYTVIPVSFLPGSMPAAIALMCVYKENRRYPNAELYFKYLDYMYLHQPDESTDWATIQTLIKYAEATSPAIRLDFLHDCVTLETYRVQIEQNTDYGKELMNGVIITPSLYVNGIAVKTLSIEEIRKVIDEVLKKEGVY